MAEHKKYLKGLIKRCTHDAKLDVYRRIKFFSTNPRTPEAVLQEFLDAKIETHTTLVRQTPEQLG